MKIGWPNQWRVKGLSEVSLQSLSSWIIGSWLCQSPEHRYYGFCKRKRIFGSGTNLGNRRLNKLVNQKRDGCLLTSLTGKSDEQRAAAALASVLCVQLGPGIESEEVLKTLGPVLKKIICDGAASVQARQTVSMRARTDRSARPGHPGRVNGGCDDSSVSGAGNSMREFS